MKHKVESASNLFAIFGQYPISEEMLFDMTLQI